MNNEISELFLKFNLRPHKIDVYELALTHPSCNADNKTKHHDYERLEFVGDSVLGFVVADLIYKNHSEMNQGYMSKLRSSLVCSKSLAYYCRKYDIFQFIRVGHSISEKQLFNSDKILEDVFEAFIGAMYLDLGINVVYKVIKKVFLEDIKNADLNNVIDSKTRLQEDIQAEFRDEVKYRVIDESGPAHDRLFTVEVTFNGLILGRGKGKSKKAAEEAAAKDALSKRSV